MSVYASERAPTPAQDAEWASTVGTWKIGQRDPLGPERGGRQAKPSGDTRLVSNFDPVSGRHHVGLFSVGRQGWRNQRRKHRTMATLLRRVDRNLRRRKEKSNREAEAKSQGIAQIRINNQTLGVPAQGNPGTQGAPAQGNPKAKSKAKAKAKAAATPASAAATSSNFANPTLNSPPPRGPPTAEQLASFKLLLCRSIEAGKE